MCLGQSIALLSMLTTAPLTLHPACLQSMPWAAAEAPSQAPVGSTTATTAAAPKKKSNLGAILGGAIGGGVGGLVVLGAAAYFLLRKKGSANSAYSVGNPTYAPQSGALGRQGSQLWRNFCATPSMG